MTAFREINIGEKFHTGKSFGAGINSHRQIWVEYEKISKSQAKIVAMPGFSHSRYVGNVKKISANESVWRLE